MDNVPPAFRVSFPDTASKAACGSLCCFNGNPGINGSMDVNPAAVDVHQRQISAIGGVTWAQR